MTDGYSVRLFIRLTASSLCLALIFMSVMLISSSPLFDEDREQVAQLADSLAQDEEIMPVIIIDAGHGGQDGGAVSPSGVVEKDINLALALQLYEICQSFGYDAVLTRDGDHMLSTDDGEGSRKMQDLRARLCFTEKHGQCIFISLHQNKFPSADCSGFQAYYSKNHKSSEFLAELFTSAVNEYLHKSKKRQIKAADSSIYLLDRAKCPAVLLECGFLSNPSDLAELTDPEYRTGLCLVLFHAINRYLG